MIQEKLEDHKKALVEAVELTQKDLSALEGSKTTLVQNLEQAKAALDEKKASFLAAHTTFEQAKESVIAAGAALAQAKENQKKGDASHESLGNDKAAMEAAYLEHFKKPMEANECLVFAHLQPFVALLGLEESLTSALPSSCTKPKEQRGGFDDLVLTELGKALEGKIAALAKSLEEETVGVAQRKEAVTAAETALESATTVEKTAAADRDAAADAQHAAEAVATKASEEWTTFEPRVKEATDNHNLRDTTRMEFEQGVLKEFFSLRDKVPVPAGEDYKAPEEAAPAGA